MQYLHVPRDKLMLKITLVVVLIHNPSDEISAAPLNTIANGSFTQVVKGCCLRVLLWYITLSARWQHTIKKYCSSLCYVSNLFLLETCYMQVSIYTVREHLSVQISWTFSRWRRPGEMWKSGTSQEARLIVQGGRIKHEHWTLLHWFTRGHHTSSTAALSRHQLSKQIITRSRQGTWQGEKREALQRTDRFLWFSSYQYIAL